MFLRGILTGVLVAGCGCWAAGPLWSESPQPDGPACQPASGEAGEGEGLPSDAELEALGARIGTVEIVVNDIFDPEHPRERWWPYRLVNRLHRNTRTSVVHHLLLFTEGDPYSGRLLEESERLLRSNRLFFDASVRPVRVRGQEVDVEVVVQDVWTLTAGVRFRREGGENETGINLHDRNFLGLGKNIDLERKSDVDRTTNVLRFRDPNLLGSRFRLDVQYGDNSDGTQRSLEIERPFFALDTRWAAAAAWSSETRLEHTYSGGHKTSSFLHDTTFGEVMAGYSTGLRGGFARRWMAGITYDRHGYASADGSAWDDTAGRELLYPWVGIEIVEDSFAELVNLDQIVRTEDVHVGRSLRARVGWSSPSFGGDSNRLVFDVETTSATIPHDGVLVRLSASASGRWSHDTSENVLVGGAASVHWRDLGRHLAFAALSFDVAHHLDPENQLLIGGDSGLRGYPLRYQDGDRRVLLTVEQRFFTDWYPLRLFHVGAAAFVDVGHAWFARDGFGSGGGVLGDVGVGLRLSSSRSGDANVLHVDLALPLNRDGDISGVQLSVRTKSSF